MAEPLTPYVGWYGKPRRQDWQTPLALFRSWHEEYGFTLDGAAEDHNALLPAASTPESPVPWRGHRVFCNPPWSAIGPFVEQAVEADLAVLLVPARTNAKWFHRALALGASVRYFQGRPSFRNSQHDGTGHNSPVDCLLLVFSPPKTWLDQPMASVEEAELRTLLESPGRHWITRDWSEDCARLLATLDAARATPDPAAGLREALRPWLVHKMNCASTEGYGVKDGVRLTPQKPCDCGLDAAPLDSEGQDGQWSTDLTDDETHRLARALAEADFMNWPAITVASKISGTVRAIAAARLASKGDSDAD